MQLQLLNPFMKTAAEEIKDTQFNMSNSTCPSVGAHYAEWPPPRNKLYNKTSFAVLQSNIDVGFD